MASLRELVSYYKVLLCDGTNVAFWKEGRSWYATVLKWDDPKISEKIKHIRRTDPKATVMKDCIKKNYEPLSNRHIIVLIRYFYGRSTNSLDDFMKRGELYGCK